VIKKKQPASTRSNNILLRSNSEANPHPIPLHVLEEATNQFDEDKVIGTGGFGKFHKAVMQGGCKIAI
jgi:hypothetical protein